MTALASGLLLWGLLSLGAALLGLWWAQHPFWRGFFFMNGAWGLADGALGLYALGREAPGNLREILLLNAGLDVLYLLGGTLLLLRGRKPQHRGFRPGHPGAGGVPPGLRPGTHPGACRLKPGQGPPVRSVPGICMLDIPVSVC